MICRAASPFLKGHIIAGWRGQKDCEPWFASGANVKILRFVSNHGDLEELGVICIKTTDLMRLERWLSFADTGV